MPLMNAPPALPEVASAVSRFPEAGETRFVHLTQFSIAKAGVRCLRTPLGDGRQHPYRPTLREPQDA
ncbi:MAG: hypothetical protein JNL98_26550 [Bryobacterales bacterium]|nr:hypothetical protein [Bryobacterales bacterium]